MDATTDDRLKASEAECGMLRAELAQINGRNCIDCVHYSNESGECFHTWDTSDKGFVEIIVPKNKKNINIPDHYCKSWKQKEGEK